MISLLCFNGVVSPLVSFTSNILVLLMISGSTRGAYFFLKYSSENQLHILFVMIKWFYGISKMFVGFYLSSPNLMCLLWGLFLIDFYSLAISSCMLFSNVGHFQVSFVEKKPTLYFLTFMKIKIKINLLKYSVESIYNENAEFTIDSVNVLK